MVRRAEESDGADLHRPVLRDQQLQQVLLHGRCNPGFPEACRRVGPLRTYPELALGFCWRIPDLALPSGYLVPDRDAKCGRKIRLGWPGRTVLLLPPAGLSPGLLYILAPLVCSASSRCVSCCSLVPPPGEPSRVRTARLALGVDGGARTDGEGGSQPRHEPLHLRPYALAAGGCQGRVRLRRRAEEARRILRAQPRHPFKGDGECILGTRCRSKVLPAPPTLTADSNPE